MSTIYIPLSIEMYEICKIKFLDKNHEIKYTLYMERMCFLYKIHVRNKYI